MTDPLYVGDFFIEQPLSVKQEPVTMDTSSNCLSASMPIPARKMMDLSELRDFGFEFVDVSSPSFSHDGGLMTAGLPASTLYQSLSSSTSLWGARMSTEVEPPIRTTDTFRMDDDDIFQVDKADLIQGPTLAELNANDENLLEDLNFDDLLLPEENSYYINVPAGGVAVPVPGRQVAPPLVQVSSTICTPLGSTGNGPGCSGFAPSSFPPPSLGFYKDTFSSGVGGEQLNCTARTPSPLGSSPLQQRHSTLHELLLRKETAAGQGASCATSRLSSSAPTHLGLDQIWQRREPRQHLLSTSSLAEAGSTSSISTGGVLSPESHDFSHDEGFDSEDDSDHYEDFSSDAESMSDGEGGGRPLSSSSKKERYFWQYNVQAKGPKGQRLVLKTQLEDPHVLNEVTDPVFSPQCSVRGIKHSGKARKGDGNDLTPNPRKLCCIGRELDKLSRIINDMTPVSELPFNVRPKTRKEKNKLASRACRLKKKAQHEANKLKLYGLENEHKRLNTGIGQVKQVLAAKFTAESPETQEELTRHIEKIVKTATKVKIAGNTTEFVNRILDKVKGGVPGGGLSDL